MANDNPNVTPGGIGWLFNMPVPKNRNRVKITPAYANPNLPNAYGGLALIDGTVPEWAAGLTSTRQSGFKSDPSVDMGMPASPPNPEYQVYYRGGGGGGGRKPVNWREAYTVEGAPEWWRGLLPNQFNAQSTYAALYNAMIPFLSPEDQRTVAQHLGGLYSKRPMWQTYNPEATDFAKPPVELTPEMMEQFTSSDRAKKALQTLDKVASISGKKKGFGAGYTFLRQLLKTMQDFGGGAVGAGNRQSRVQYQQMQSALDPLLASMKNTEFAGLAQQLTAPFFTAGRVVPISKDVTGRYVFGSPNKQLFG